MVRKMYVNALLGGVAVAKKYANVKPGSVTLPLTQGQRLNNVVLRHDMVLPAFVSGKDRTVVFVDVGGQSFYRGVFRNQGERCLHEGAHGEVLDPGIVDDLAEEPVF